MAKRSRKKKPPPKCKAILLCDQVIVDALTGKLSIIGIFEQFNVASYPVTTAPCTAFLQMTDGIGDYAITLEIHDLTTGTILGRAQGPTIVFPNRHAKVNFFIPIPPMRLPHAGAHDFVVFADGAEIDRQQFNVRELGGRPPGGNGHPR
jgi:hypothetical protein